MIDSRLMNSDPLVIRVDASVAMGTGHVMRCLALAQAWQDSGGRAVFAVTEIPPAIRQKLLAESFEVVPVSSTPGKPEDTIQTIALGRKQRCEWIVVDGYQFGAGYQLALKRAGFKVLFLDDYGHAGRYSADLVLNQNAGASAELYGNRDPQTRLLLGPRYCLLRREFAAWRGWRREITAAGRKVLVTIGGSDPGNLTGLVVEALRALHDIEATVVVGGSNPHFGDLEQATWQFGGWLQLRQNASNMSELMAWADLAVAGAGTTCWEACLLRLPMVLIDIADNQKPIARSLHALGAAIHLGAAGDVTEEEIGEQVLSLLASETERAVLSERCGKLVDGRGTERAIDELTRS